MFEHKIVGYTKTPARGLVTNAFRGDLRGRSFEGRVILWVNGKKNPSRHVRGLSIIWTIRSH